jgi:hypothetical protein
LWDVNDFTSVKWKQELSNLLGNSRTKFMVPAMDLAPAGLVRSEKASNSTEPRTLRQDGVRSKPPPQIL